MNMNYEITLVYTPKKQDSIGNWIEDQENQKKRSVLADCKSISQSEFYQAGAAGLKPERTFIIWTLLYKKDQHIIHEGVTYTILRTFERKDNKIELVCEAMIGHV